MLGPMLLFGPANSLYYARPPSTDLEKNSTGHGFVTPPAVDPGVIVDSGGGDTITTLSPAGLPSWAVPAGIVVALGAAYMLLRKRPA